MSVLTRTRRAGTIPAMPDDVLTVAETAERFGVTRSRVYQWLKAGLPVAPESPRDPYTGEVLRTYIRVADVELFKVSQRKRRGRPGHGAKQLPPGLEWADVDPKPDK